MATNDGKKKKSPLIIKQWNKRAPKFRCVAPGCDSNSFSEGLTFHFFPQNEVLRSQWLLNIGNPKIPIYRASRLCSIHFDSDCFERNQEAIVSFDLSKVPSSKRLKKGAVPKITPLAKAQVQAASLRQDVTVGPIRVPIPGLKFPRIELINLIATKETQTLLKRRSYKTQTKKFIPVKAKTTDAACQCIKKVVHISTQTNIISAH